MFLSVFKRDGVKIKELLMVSWIFKENMTSTDVLFVTSSSGKSFAVSIYPYLG